MKKIAVAMSGGVDSSVAALVLKNAGFDVVGITMRLFSCSRIRSGSCCSEQDRLDARRVCMHLGIPHTTVDLSRAFKERVVEPFVNSYIRGETPSPCILCNEHLKFDALLDEARKLGLDTVATGHYARIEIDDDERAHLLRGVDDDKDQSYFLFPAVAGILNHLVFPVGDLSKTEVRRLASENRLPVHEKDESQEICFVPDNDYTSFVESERPHEMIGPGAFVDKDGNELGRHRGIHAYTIGQRRGLGIGFGERKYVVKIDARRNEIVLGDAADLARTEMVVRNVVWAHSRKLPLKAEVQIRSTRRAKPATIEDAADGNVRVVFDEAERAIAPGQAAVFYIGNEVIGGGWIANDECRSVEVSECRS